MDEELLVLCRIIPRLKFNIHKNFELMEMAISSVKTIIKQKKSGYGSSI